MEDVLVRSKEKTMPEVDEALENVQEIPQEVIFAKIRDLLITYANAGSINSEDEFKKILNSQPLDKMMLMPLVNEIARANNHILVRATPVSESIRELEKKNKKRWKITRALRVLFGSDLAEQTDFIREHHQMLAEMIAARNEKLKEQDEALKIRKEARAEKLKAEKLSQEIIEKANLAAEKRSQEMMTQALVTQQRTIDQAQELTKDSGARAERMQIESNRKLAEIENKIEAKEKELAMKKALTAEFEKNPEVVREWEKKNQTNNYKNALAMRFDKRDGKLLAYNQKSSIEFNEWSLNNSEKMEIINFLHIADGTLIVLYRWLVQPPVTKEITNEKVADESHFDPCINNPMLL